MTATTSPPSNVKGADRTWSAPPDPNFTNLSDLGWQAYRRDKPDLLAFDTETGGLAFKDRAFCVTVSWHARDEGLECHYFELATPGVRERLKLMFSETYTLVGHNLKYDLQKCIQEGLILREDLVPERLEDTEALAHLDDEHRLKGLKSLAVNVLGYEDYIEVEVKTGPRVGQIKRVPREKHELDAVRRKMKLTREQGYEVLPRAVIVPYAKKDAEFTLLLYHELKPKIQKFADLYDLYRQEMALSLVFLDMETKGMGIDIAYVAEKVTEYGNRVLDLEKEIEVITGRDVGKAKTQFNPNSNPQIAGFFSALGFERSSYDEENLRSIDHPLAAVLIRLRSDQKILTTYFRALHKGTEGDVFHPSIRQHGTVTGRTSAGGQKGDN